MEIVNLLENYKLSKDIGGKGNNLATLANHSINVPKSYAIGNKCYQKFVHKLKPNLQNIIKLNSPSVAYNKISKLFLESPLDSNLELKLNKMLKNFQDDSYFAVRSSGITSFNGEYILEDSEKNSLAGQFDSYLKVSKKNIKEALKLCWASLFNERSLISFDSGNNNTYLDSKMSVILQEMIDANKSVVMMTKDPLEKKNTLGIESTYGPCEALVSGKVEGDFLLYDRNSKSVIMKDIGSKKHKIIYSKFSKNKQRNISFRKNSKKMREKYSLNNKELEILIETGLKIESIFQKPQDIEAVFSNYGLYVVQSRNITTLN